MRKFKEIAEPPALIPVARWRISVLLCLCIIATLGLLLVHRVSQ